MRAVLVWVMALLLAAFFAFVGSNKAFAPLADLAKYGAWTVHLPEVAGRIIGWSEMFCAAALLVPRTRFWAALLLIANQLAAAATHAARHEFGALPQNVALVGLLLALAISSKSKEENV